MAPDVDAGAQPTPTNGAPLPAPSVDAGEPDRLPPCPELEPLCHTGGYAHFPISNVAGSGLPNEVSYTVAEELVSDRVSGLVWQRASSPSEMGWDEAREHCAGLTLGGRDDFRLPGRIELVTVLDFTEVPVVASAFDAVADYHWSASRASFVQGSAYSVYFGAGETAIARADPGRARALCVAGAIGTVAEPRFVSSSETVTDRGTGLEWEASTGAPADFTSAGERCAELGFRLPSIRELQSIVDERRHDPAIDTQVFTDARSEFVWSSSLGQGWPWLVDFTDGTTRADIDPSEAHPSRCVR